MSRRSLALLSITLTLFACEKESATGDDPTRPPGEEALWSVIDAAGGSVPVEESKTVTEESSDTEERDESIWRCTRQTVDQTQDGAGAEGYPLFSPNSAVVFPGNLLQGASLAQATPDAVNVRRAGGAFSIDLLDGNRQSAARVDSVTASTVSTALNQIIAAAPGEVPANFFFTYENVQSREQLAASLRMSYESFTRQIEGKLSFSSDASYERFVVRLNQSYYTMRYDAPTSLEAVFHPSVTPERLSRFTGPGNPIGYISSVTYGRTYFMLIESTSSRTEMEAALEGSLGLSGSRLEGEAEVSSLNELDELRIKVFGYGGDAAATQRTIGKTNLSELVDLLAEAGTITSGRPLSYTVNSLYDDRLISTKLATSYDVVECLPVAPSSVPYTAHWTGRVLELLGPVGAGFAPNGTEFILISKDGQRFLRSRPGELEGPFPVDELFPDAPLPMAGIGAAVSYYGNESGRTPTIWAIDPTGTQYSVNSGYSDQKWSQPQPIAMLDDGYDAKYPLAGGGIGAIAFAYSNPPEIDSWLGLYNTAGTELVSRLIGQGNSIYLSPSSIGSSGDFPFTSVGGAIGFNINEKTFVIGFDGTGERYTISGDLNGDGNNTLLGVFDL